MTWQPIETAPRDGTDVLLFVPKFQKKVRLGHFIDKEDLAYGKSVAKRQYWYIGFLPFDTYPEPTHWMPLPESPNEMEKVR